MSLRRLTALALCTTLALAIYAVESAVPPLVPIPGIKLGLANIATLILLRRASLKDAALVTTARILISALLFGQLLSLLYSLAGAVFALAAMYLSNRLFKNRYPYLTGALGGLAHNGAQLLTALAVTATPGVLAYLPFLVLSGILTGLFTGLCSFYGDKYLLRHLRQFKD